MHKNFAYVKKKQYFCDIKSIREKITTLIINPNSNHYEKTILFFRCNACSRCS